MKRFAPPLVGVSIIVVLGGYFACRQNPPPVKSKAHAADVSAQWSERLFTSAIDSLNQFETVDATEMLGRLLLRMNQVRESPPELKKDPLVAGWPESDVLQDALAQLNQWVEGQEPPSDWKPDPLLATLAPPLADSAFVRDVGTMRFTRYDSYTLLEAIWLRDIAAWARGKTADDLDQARRLFDWTVRNIQLEDDDSDRPPLVPWEILLCGRGTAMERAWIYILLLRQQGIDAGMLILPMPEAKPISLLDIPAAKDKPAEAASRLRPWCVAVLVGEKDRQKLYLFDPALGVPIPAKNGIRVARDGALDIQPAALDEVRADPRLMDPLDDDAQNPYWAKKADLKHLAVAVEASPGYLAKRMKLVESHLAGGQKMVLSTMPSLQAERLKSAASGAETRMWNLPYRTLEWRSIYRPEVILNRLISFLPYLAAPGTPLLKGRILHLKGRFFDDNGAIASYQAARPSTQDLTQGLHERVNAYYKARVKNAQPNEREATLAGQEAVAEARVEIGSMDKGKTYASYWLGLIAYEQGNLDSAIDYFGKRTLEDNPQGVFSSGAHYNLARCRELQGQQEKAIAEYAAAGSSMAKYGNVLRARWLKEFGGKTEKEAGKK